MVQENALLLLEKQGDFTVGELDVPKPGPGELLVKVIAAGLDPVDWKVAKWAKLRGPGSTAFSELLGIQGVRLCLKICALTHILIAP